MPPKATPHADFGSTTSYSTLTATHGQNNYNLTILRKELANINSRAEKELPGKDEYARVGSLEQAHVDAVAGGDPVAISAALASWNTARNTYNRKIGSRKGQTIPTAALRKKWDKDRKDALAYYEDFLFYQNPSLRRGVTMRRTETVSALLRRFAIGGWVPRLWSDPEDDIGRSHAFLNSWLGQQIGGPTDRMNMTHDKLHVITPYPRRKATGVGKPHWPKIRSDRSNQFLVIKTNDANIEARRLEIETKRGYTTLNPDTTHSIRRKAEIISKVVENDIVLSQALQHTRNKNTGLYISAKERPTDWPVSYDCLDKVRSGFICIDPRTVTHNHQIEEQTRARERDREDGRETDDGPGRVTERTLEGVQKLLLSTQWFEATYGRREFHAYAYLPPPSPIDSPPHSPRPPIYEDEDYNSMVVDESSTSDPDPEPPAVIVSVASKRKREKGGIRQKSVAVKDVANRIKAVRRHVTTRRLAKEEHFQRQDGRENPPGKQIPVNVQVSNDFYEPYKTNFRDHHGIRTPNWPIKEKAVPYHPVDKAKYLMGQFDKLPKHGNLPGPPDGLLDIANNYMKPAPDSTSMSMIRDVLRGNVTTRSSNGSIPGKDVRYREPTRYETVQMKSNYWVNGNKDEDMCQDNETENETDSDDEGDLFTQSYRAGYETDVPALIPPIDRDMPHDHVIAIAIPHSYPSDGFNNDGYNGISRKRQRLE